jgi:hypothetical protein
VALNWGQQHNRASAVVTVEKVKTVPGCHKSTVLLKQMKTPKEQAGGFDTAGCTIEDANSA